MTLSPSLNSSPPMSLVLAPGQRRDLNRQRLDVLLVAHLEGVPSEGDVARLVVGPAVIAGRVGHGACLGSVGQVPGRVCHNFRLCSAFQE